MSESEAAILKTVKPEAKKLGLRALRVSMRTGVEVGWPDNFVFGPPAKKNEPGRVLGLETKRPGKPATPMQLERGREMVAYGQCWAKCDTKEDVRFTLFNFAMLCTGQRPMSRAEWKRTVDND